MLAARNDPSLKRKASDDLDRAEPVDLSGVDLKKSYKEKSPADSLETPGTVKRTEPAEDASNNKGLSPAVDPIPAQNTADKFEESAESQYVYSGVGPNGEEVRKGDEYYRTLFAVFNLNYDFETDSFVEMDKISPVFLEVPTERDIYKFCKKILICSKMEKEIPIIALLYIEKVMLKTGLLMNQVNWRRFTFIALVIASKVRSVPFCYLPT